VSKRYGVIAKATMLAERGHIYSCTHCNVFAAQTILPAIRPHH